MRIDPSSWPGVVSSYTGGVSLCLQSSLSFRPVITVSLLPLPPIAPRGRGQLGQCALSPRGPVLSRFVPPCHCYTDPGGIQAVSGSLPPSLGQNIVACSSSSRRSLHSAPGRRNRECPFRVRLPDGPKGIDSSIQPDVGSRLDHQGPCLCMISRGSRASCSTSGASAHPALSPSRDTAWHT